MASFATKEEELRRVCWGTMSVKKQNKIQALADFIYVCIQGDEIDDQREKSIKNKLEEEPEP